MKNDFLTIPAAPNYEINSDLIVRNKRTGKTLKPIKNRKGAGKYFCLWRSKKQTIQSGKSLRQQAESTIEIKGAWLSIPSLKNKYEINKLGELRNTRTKRKLKLCADGRYVVLVDGKVKNVRQKMLLWEVHGEIYKSRKAVAVIAKKESLALKFKSQWKCAEYLVPKLHYALSYVYHKLNERTAEFCGWKFFYEEENLADVKMSAKKALKGSRR